jgi:hypothetical protein
MALSKKSKLISKMLQNSDARYAMLFLSGNILRIGRKDITTGVWFWRGRPCPAWQIGRFCQAGYS